MFTRAAATPRLTKPGATIQVRTPGTMVQSPICLRAAQLPPPERTTAGGYWQEATSTSPLAPVRSPGTPLPTPGATCQTWYRRAITSEAQLRANPSTRWQAALVPALLAMTTSSTPRPAAQRQLQLRQLQLRQLQLPPRRLHRRQLPARQQLLLRQRLPLRP